eukprot:Colp12_sorted_trinity150504_noHs@14154
MIEESAGLPNEQTGGAGTILEDSKTRTPTRSESAFSKHSGTENSDADANRLESRGAEGSSRTDDPRRMRRIIAEDPEWNIPSVPHLADLCVNHIVKNFDSKPILHGLPPKYKTRVLELLSTTIPISVTAPLIASEAFWKRSCKTRFKNCDVEPGKLWKELYFEKHVAEVLESFVPTQGSISDLTDTLQLVNDFVKCVNIQQLLPPPPSMDKSDPDEVEDPLERVRDHLNLKTVLENLPHLESLTVVYGVKHCAMSFDWSLFGTTKLDCQLLAEALKMPSKLTHLAIHRSAVDDEKVRVLVSHLLESKTLTHLDLSHNKVGDSGARALGKLLTSKTHIRELNFHDNQINAAGALALGKALEVNKTLQVLYSSCFPHKLGWSALLSLLAQLCAC